jgi:hypothetical protein
MNSSHFVRKCSRWAVLLLAAAPGWSGNSLEPARFAIAPLFHKDPTCSEDGHLAVWTPDLRGCFGSSRIRLESRQAGVEIVFAGSASGVPPVLAGSAEARLTFMRGDSPQGLRTMAAHTSLRYTGLYPDIDLVYGSSEGRLKAEFHVAPGADPSSIRLRYSGSPWLDGAGNLVVDVDGGVFREDAPIAYQEIAGQRVPVGASFALSAGEVGFRIGPYDREHPLIIDPTLTFSTLFGGSGSTVNALAIDSAGNTYVAGCTDSTAPTVNAVQGGNKGRTEAFAGKLRPDGTLMYATYLGGSGSDCATGIAVDTTGAATVVGWTTSSNFPAAGAYQPRLQGGRDGFVTRLGPLGDRLSFSTFLGGALPDTVNGVAVDAAGNIYVAGETASSDFPLRNAVQAALKGGTDAFLAEFTASGDLIYSTFYGGLLDDFAKAVAVTADGVASIVGCTYSLDLRMAGAILSRNSGGQDAFIARFGQGGGALNFATYFGGSRGSSGSPEYATSIAADAAGRIYVTGITASPDFPVKNAAFATARGGIDGFVAKFAPASSELLYSTYLGGSSVDLAAGIAVDAAGNAHIAGATWSPDFPSAGQLSQRKHEYDAFVTRLDTGGAVSLSVCLAGSAADSANAIAVDAAGDISVAGQTASTDFPLINAFGTPTGALHGMVARISIDASPAPISVSPASGSGHAQQFTIVIGTPGGPGTLFRTFVAIGGGAACYVVYAGNALYLLNDAGTEFLRPVMPGSGESAENGQCRIRGSGSWVLSSATNLTLTVDFYFKPAFAGARNIAVRSESTTGKFSNWRDFGSWTVTADPAAGGPSVVSVSPSSGSGHSSTFMLTSVHPAGAGNLLRTYVSFASSGSSAMCYVVYVAGALYLLNDSRTDLIGAMVGTQVSVENSLCRIKAATSSVTTSGATQILTIDVSFKAAFAGFKTIDARVEDIAGQSSAFKTVGAWTVTVDPAAALEAISVNPAAGSGAGGKFTFTSTDPAGANDLLRTYIVIAAPNSTAACYIVFAAPSGLYLLNDSKTEFLRGIVPGFSDAVENSQCRLNAAGSSVVNSGITQTLTLDLFFKPAFAGTKSMTVLLETKANLLSAWKVVGTWNVTP